MQNKKILVSPIAIDLGSKYTGVYHSSFFQEESWEEAKHMGFVLVDRGNVKWSQKDRLTTRHQSRAIKRRKLAKRFFKMIVKAFYPDLEIDEFLLGLFNRRGYTYLATNTEDIFQEIFENHASDLGVFCNSEISSIEDLQNKIYEKWLSDPMPLEIPLTPKGKPDTKSVQKKINDIYASYSKAETEGHKKRIEYFKNIKKDLSDKKMDDSLYNLIGNISNFQLRFLRKYFNNKNFANEDRWDEERFNNLLNRYLSSWHVKTADEKSNLKEIRSKIGKDFLLKIDPIKTIPPYEDQNNRAPIRCKTLLLTEEKLDRMLPNWKNKYNRAFTESVSNTARDFQRYLDEPRSGKIESRISSILSHLIGDQEDLALEKFLKKYFKEAYDARYGFWSDDLNGSKVFTICNNKTGHKKKQQGSNLDSIFQINLFRQNESAVNDFKLSVTNYIFERKKIKGILEKCAKLQKIYGNRLGYEIERAIEADIKEVVKEIQKDSFKKFFKDYFSQSNEDIKKYCNVFSLGQIYNICFEDIHGFSSSCKYCSEENAIRMSLEEKVVRLATITSKPIDGVVGRLLDRISWEIVSKVGREIGIKKFDELKIPIIIEQNSFKFQEDLLDIKNDTNKRKKEKILKRKTSWENEVQDKWKRIENSSEGICPYTGQILSSNGEYDHIIPRSYSLKNHKTIFDTEVNLIYCSAQGNREKKDHLYRLENLNDQYLFKVFGKSKREEIKADLIDFWNSNPHLNINQLTPDEKTKLRHCLFVEEIRRQIIEKLNQQIKSKVNGTQKYLGVLLKKKIENKYAEIKDKLSISLFFVDAEKRYALREVLSSKNSKYKKESFQGLDSHVVDAALCASIGIGEDLDIEKIIPREIEIIAFEKRPLEKKKDVSSEKIFKAGLFAERYVPIYAQKEQGLIKWFVGFSSRNLSPINRKYLASMSKAVASFGLFKGVEISSLDELLEFLKEGSFIYFEVNKNKLHDAYELNDVNDSLVLDFFDEIRYKTKKENVEDFILDKNKIMSEENLKNKISTASKSKFFNIEIVLPFKQSWDKVFLEMHDANLFSGEKKVQDIPRGFFDRLFPREKEASAHHKVRKVFSLPVLNKNGSFRLKRKNFFSQQNVWQCASSEMSQVSDFQIQAGQAVPIVHEAYRNSKSIVMLDRNESHVSEAQTLVGVKEFVEFSVPDLFKEEGLIKLFFSLNAKGRCRCKLIINRDKVKTTLGVDVTENIKEKYKSNLTQKILGSDQLGKIRGDLIVHSFNEKEIEFSYEQESSSITLKKDILHNYETSRHR